MKTRVVLVDDHAGLREMLAAILMRDGEYEIAGQAGSGLEALQICHGVAHEVIILDLCLPELCGVEVLRRLRAELPQSRVLIYSGTVNQLQVIQTLRLRPHGFVEKCDSLENLREGLRAVASGRCFFSRFASLLMIEAHHAEEMHLTRREREVLQLVAESRSSKEIAVRLGLAVKTVENHRAHLMDKLHLHDVAALTRYAVRTGMVSDH